MYFILTWSGWEFSPIPVKTSSKALATGEIITKGDEIVDLQFDTGTPYGRFCALTELPKLADKLGLSLRPSASGHDSGKFITAFGWLDGKLYFGNSHFDVWESASHWNDELERDAWKRNAPTDQPMAFGYILDEGDHLEAEFYSDFFEADQDPKIFGTVFTALQARYPELTAMTYGPDEQTTKDMKEWADKQAFTYISDGKNLQIL